MRVWIRAGGGVVALGALALVVVWSAGVAGQQRTFTVTAGSGDQNVIVREGGPLQLFRTLADDGGPKIGVSIREVTGDDVTKLKLQGQAGVVVDEVTADSPAAKSGVQKGDTFVAYDGETVRSVAQFRRLVRESVAGRSVKATVVRDGKRVDVTVTPADDTDREVEAGIVEPLRRPRVEQFRMPRGDRPGAELPLFRWDAQEGPNVFMFRDDQRGRLGVMLQDLSPALAEYFGVKEGALIATVNKGTPAEKAGLRAGDVITAVDGKTVTGASEVAEHLRDKSGEVAVTVMRDKKSVTVKATIEKPATSKPKVVTPGFPG